METATIHFLMSNSTYRIIRNMLLKVLLVLASKTSKLMQNYRRQILVSGITKRWAFRPKLQAVVGMVVIATFSWSFWHKKHAEIWPINMVKFTGSCATVTTENGQNFALPRWLKTWISGDLLSHFFTKQGHHSTRSWITNSIISLLQWFKKWPGIATLKAMTMTHVDLHWNLACLRIILKVNEHEKYKKTL